MRRSDREVKDINDIAEIIKECDVCRLALNDKDYPYILPVNFAMKIEEEKISLYFHGAVEGRKYAVIAADNRASFEMDCGHKLISDVKKGYCTMSYKSVIGYGKIIEVFDEEKYEGLCLLVNHFHKEGFEFNPAAIPRTRVFKLEVEHLTGKIKA
jgi:hypothetical protein